MARLDKYLHAALLRKLKEDPFYAEVGMHTQAAYATLKLPAA